MPASQGSRESPSGRHRAGFAGTVDGAVVP